MRQKLLFLATAPLLWWQGKRVRASTPRLPEAAGERSGNARQQPSLKLLLLGDSAIAGVGCETQAEALTGQLLQCLSDYQVQWQLVARSSLTCAGVFALLQSTELIAPKFDVVVISVGVNDVTRRTSVQQWRRDLQRMTAYLQQQLGCQQVLYTELPPMHKFPALPQPLRWFVGNQARTLNTALEEHCQSHSGAEVLSFDIPYRPEYLAKDGYHPSPAAAQIWAAGAAQAIQQQFIVTTSGEEA